MMNYEVSYSLTNFEISEKKPEQYEKQLHKDVKVLSYQRK